jgi:sarcosine oxidase
VDAGRANAVHQALARANGAEILDETPVRSIRPSGEGVEVVAGDETYYADRVVVAGGAWTNQILKDTGVEIPLTVTQEQVTYYSTPNLRDFAPDRFPVFIWSGTRSFYGFPVYGEVATKLGQHVGGHEVTADTRTFDADPLRQEAYRDFLSRHIPGFLGPELFTKTCLYTIPPDQNFIISSLPDHPQISKLALDGESSYPIEPFSLTRPAITDGSFQKVFHA